MLGWKPRVTMTRPGIERPQPPEQCGFYHDKGKTSAYNRSSTNIIYEGLAFTFAE